jgi:hypothetical protein
LLEVLEVRSYFTIHGQSVCFGVGHPLGIATRYYFLSEWCCLKVVFLFLWGALSDDRTGLQFPVQSLNGPSCAEPVIIIYCLVWDPPSPNLADQLIVFISPRNRVAQLYPRALGSLYVASCDSQGYSPPTWRARSPYIYPSGTGLSISKSKSSYDWRSVNMSSCLVHAALDGLHPNEFKSDIRRVTLRRNCLCYHWESCMWSMQCNVEFGYQLSICFGTKENHGKPWSSWPVPGPSRCKLTSSQQSGIKYASPNISSYAVFFLF